MTEQLIEPGERQPNYEVEVVNTILTFEPVEHEKLVAALEEQRNLRAAERALITAAERVDEIKPRGAVQAAQEIVGYWEEDVNHTDFGSVSAIGSFESDHPALKDATIDVGIIQKCTDMVCGMQKHDFPDKEGPFAEPQYEEPTSTFALIFNYMKTTQEVEVHILTANEQSLHAADFSEVIEEPLIDRLRFHKKIIEYS